jgi:hypothetical protein
MEIILAAIKIRLILCYSYSYGGLSDLTPLFPNYIIYVANNLTPYLKVSSKY